MTAEQNIVITEDGDHLMPGHRAWNYYDMEFVTLTTVDHDEPTTCACRWHPETTTWATWTRDDGSTVTLDGSRVVSILEAQRRGWAE